MKVRLSNFNKFEGFSSLKNAASSGASHRFNEQAHYKKGVNRIVQGKHLIIEDKSENTNIKRPVESVSFGGSASSGAAAAKHKTDIAEKLAKSKTFHKMAYFSDDNEAKVKALLALGLAGILKPICVLAMPGAEEEDKQFTATKNALSAFIGYLLTCAVLDPISSGVNKFMDNPKEYLAEDNWLVKTFEKEAKQPFNILTKQQIKDGKQNAIKNGLPYYVTDMKSGFKTVYKNGLGVIVAPLKAALTIALMPYVLKFIFGDSKGKKKAEEQEQMSPQMEILNNSALTATSMNSNNFDKIFDKVTKGGIQQ